MASRTEIFDAWHAGRLDALVLRQLAVIVGEPLADLGRSADLIWMGFGTEIAAPSRLDPERRMARYRLHLQCPFRLDSPTGVIATAADVYQPTERLDARDPFDWDEPGSNVFDVAVAHFWATHPPGQLNVEGIAADRYGGVVIQLSAGYAIRVFPNRSGPQEHWRFFEADSGPHFVVIGRPHD